MPAGVSFNPDGTLLAIEHTREFGHPLERQERTATPPALYGHTGSISSVAFRRDGKVLASGSADGDIRLWDVETHELLGTLGAQQKHIKNVVFSPQRGVLASVGEDDSIIFWESTSRIGPAALVVSRIGTLRQKNGTLTLEPSLPESMYRALRKLLGRQNSRGSILVKQSAAIELNRNQFNLKKRSAYLSAMSASTRGVGCFSIK